MLMLALLSTNSLAGQDWCVDVETLASAGVPEAAIAQTLTSASPSLSVETVACIRALALGDAVTSSADLLLEGDVDRTSRKHADRLNELAKSPAELALLQNAWLTKKAHAIEAPNWSVAVSYDKMYDMNTVVASVGAGAEISGWLDVHKEPRLVVRCKRGHVDLFVQTGLTSARSQITKRPMAMARIDSHAPEHFPLEEATSLEALFFPGGRRWVASLRGSERLLFEYIPTRSATATIEFDIKGSEQIVEVVERACAREPWLPPDGSNSASDGGQP